MANHFKKLLKDERTYMNHGILGIVFLIAIILLIAKKVMEEF